MSADVGMRLHIGEHEHVTDREPVRVNVSRRPAARPHGRRHRRQLLLLLALVILAGFLLGLGLPIHQ